MSAPVTRPEGPGPMERGDERALRQRAERQLPPRRQDATLGDTDVERTRARNERMVHELQVREVELTLQNEALLTAQHDEAAALRCYVDLFDHAPVGYITLDQHGVIEQVNQRAGLLLAATTAELAGKKLEQFVADASQAALRRLLSNATELRSRAVEDLRLRGAAAQAVQFEVRADPTGSSLLVALIDISERQRAEAAELQLRLAQQAGRLHTEVTSRFSHELRTPLNAISGFAQLLLQGSRVPLGAEQREMVQHIAKAGEQMLLLVEEVLALPTEDGTPLSLRLTAVPLATLAAEGLPVVRAAAEAAGLRLTLHPPEGGPVVALADARQLRRVFNLLLRHAIGHCQPAAELHVAWCSQGATVELRVAWIPGPAASTPIVLGLSLAQVLVEAMGGQLSIVGKPGQESVATVTLRCAIATQVASG